MHVYTPLLDFVCDNGAYMLDARTYNAGMPAAKGHFLPKVIVYYLLKSSIHNTTVSIN